MTYTIWLLSDLIQCEFFFQKSIVHSTYTEKLDFFLFNLKLLTNIDV